jgi:hypothetical protein
MEPVDQLNAMPDESIVKALEAARRRASRAEQERAELDRAIATARQEQRLLEQLLALRRDGLIDPGAKNPEVQRDVASTPSTKTAHSALQAAVEELESAGRPLHISELMRLLRNRNIQIPGSGTQANLITHLRRDQRVVRPSRGMYGLTTWGLQDMQAPHRRRRRRKRMVSTKNEERTNA